MYVRKHVWHSSHMDLSSENNKSIFLHQKYSVIPALNGKFQKIVLNRCYIMGVLKFKAFSQIVGEIKEGVVPYNPFLNLK